MFAFSSYLTKWKYYDNSDKLVIGKMKDKTESVGIEESFGVKLWSFLVDNNEHTEAKGINKNVVATISRSEYKDVLVNKKFIITIITIITNVI